MTILNFIHPILPELSIICGSLLILILDIFFAKNRQEFYKISYLISLIFCLISLYFITKSNLAPQSFFNYLYFSNGFTHITKFILIILLIFITILSLDFLQNNKNISAEFLSLTMISTVGAMFLISANDFLTLYLSIELQSLPLYLLATINKKSGNSSEGGVKYFVLGSTASGLLLLGISLFYGFSGTTNFDAAFALYSQNQVPPAVVLGFVLVVIAMFFKISAAPFHLWAPDIYQGSPTIVTSFFATVSKLSATLILIRIFLDVSTGFVGMNNVLMLVAICSLIIGSFGALKQTNIKRLLAYSSIGHIGFILLALSALSIDGIKSSVIYIILYSFLSIGNFGFLTIINSLGLAKKQGENDEDDDKIFSINSFCGLYKTNPILAIIFTILLLSSAGIPPLAGFFAKFYAISSIIKSGHFAIATIAVLFSVVSAFYYLRIIKIMFFDEPNSQILSFTNRLSAKIIIAFIAIFNIAFIFFIKYFLLALSMVIGF